MDFSRCCLDALFSPGAHAQSAHRYDHGESYNGGANQTSILTIAATDAASLAITGSDGATYNLGTEGGIQAVKPAATTTYTAVATNAKGSTTATATVTVSATQPTITITANPASITSGATSTLYGDCNAATQVTVTGTDGSITPCSPQAEPRQSAQPFPPLIPRPRQAPAETLPQPRTNSDAAATLESIHHVIFLLQENHSFDSYSGC